MNAKRPGLFPLALIASAALLALVGSALAQSDGSKAPKSAAATPPPVLSIEQAQALVKGARIRHPTWSSARLSARGKVEGSARDISEDGGSNAERFRDACEPQRRLHG
jgi:hypothetical protein